MSPPTTVDIALFWAGWQDLFGTSGLEAKLLEEEYYKTDAERADLFRIIADAVQIRVGGRATVVPQAGQRLDRLRLKLRNLRAEFSGARAEDLCVAIEKAPRGTPPKYTTCVCEWGEDGTAIDECRSCTDDDGCNINDWVLVTSDGEPRMWANLKVYRAVGPEYDADWPDYEPIEPRSFEE